MEKLTKDYILAPCMVCEGAEDIWEAFVYFGGLTLLKPQLVRLLKRNWKDKCMPNRDRGGNCDELRQPEAVQLPYLN